MVIKIAQQARKHRLLGLFLAFFFFAGCKHSEPGQWQLVSVWWEDDEALGLVVPVIRLPGNFVKDSLKVFLSESETNLPVLGQIIQNDTSVIFRPMIPLTQGLTYRVSYNHLEIGTIKVPKTGSHSPEVLAVYPSTDTVPENLLKFYLKFSSPMSHISSFQNVFLIQENDTLYPFLNLQNELWNNDRSLLTLWLDPGRIKRELVPNKEMGNPLIKGNQYRLVVSDDWKDARGVALAGSYSRRLFVGERDDQSPNSERWEVTAPKAGSVGPLEIDFQESLDYALLAECLQVIDSSGNSINGNFRIGPRERKLQFFPSSGWKKGRYRIKIHSILEDLAGNNLNRLFDRQVNDTEASKETEHFYIDFQTSD